MTHAVFASLSPAHWDRLAEHASPSTYDAGTRIFEEGTEADRFWLLESGMVAVQMLVPGRGDVTIETLAAGTVLGWSWLYPPYRWTFGASCLSPTTATVFDAVAVRSMSAADAEFGLAIMNCFTPVIIERLQNTRVRLLDLYAAPSIGGVWP